ncbi:hypothetical protein SPOG_00823 [Schizosaccharomyces cryophilus OY26]|uniref:Uncharacterized protein n=1 Tax=Schizosaccharomyces cryophilus (strain OY26 / ATCC MYA-4695 / CBS 11777 / NBRC 106824 / NRRL Y48691) TaxID=653667 RepID=S9VXA9_SCHCR|nr:uncharacterized protein SPOG_00823 [Schizosaccharomyces cryophilus OY26]EPY50635.1 hypothetical protein SPOG_00823 [Schizosaccharomyces cryophilus OY26]
MPYTIPAAVGWHYGMLCILNINKHDTVRSVNCIASKGIVVSSKRPDFSFIKGKERVYLVKILCKQCGRAIRPYHFVKNHSVYILPKLVAISSVF